jgi:osmotically-inducible protein OsmY
MLGAGISIVLFTLSGCGGAKYKAMVDAAQSELSPRAIAQDDRHKLHLHEALVVEQGFSGLISAYVFMERAYLVGHVDRREQADALLRTARTIAGLRSVEGYLPLKPTGTDGSSVNNTASDAALKAEIASSLALAPGVVTSRVHVEVLDGHVVLLGVVSGEDERLHAEAAAAGVKGVTGITNWLLLPEPQYMSIRRQIL